MNHNLALNLSIIRPLAFRCRFDLRAVYLLGFSLIVFLIGFYIFQVSGVTQASFTIANLEKQITGLDKEFKNLQLNFSDTNSLSGLETALVVKGYEKVGKIYYIQVLEGAVAAK